MTPFWGWRDLLLFCGAALPALLIAKSLHSLVKLVAGPIGRAPEAMLVQFAWWGVWFAALWAIFRLWHGRGFWGSLAFELRWKPVLLCALLGPPLWIAVVGISVAIRQPEVQSTLQDLLTSWPAAILVGACAATIGPLCEELAFRGFLQPLLVRAAGTGAGIVLAALPFALVHGPQYKWSWKHILMLTVVGSAFGWARHRTGSTAASTALHGGYNLSAFLAFLASEGDMIDSW